MKDLIAYCGINCKECGAYQARKNNDDKLREKTAKNWSKRYHTELKPSDIDCDGCTSKGTIFFAHCYECGIRNCGIEKGVENCAHCPDFKCEMLKNFLTYVPPAGEKLDEIKASLK
jgi:hypothetical protein